MSCVAATDWNEATAIATAALALLTFALAVAAIIAAYYAKRSIDAELQTSAEDLRATREATEAAQTMAQRQIDASHRPLLIDVAPTGPIDDNDDLLVNYSAPRVRLAFPGGHTDDADPRAIYVHLGGPWVSIAVPLRNVGQGLAVIDPQQITAHGQRLDEMTSCEVQRQRLPPGETARIICTARMIQGQVATYPWVLSVAVPYCDFSSGQPAMAIVHLEQLGREEDWRLRDVEQAQPESADGSR